MTWMTDQIVQHLVSDDHLILQESLGDEDLVAVGPAGHAHARRTRKLLARYAIESQSLEFTAQTGARLGLGEPGAIGVRRSEALVVAGRGRIGGTPDQNAKQRTGPTSIETHDTDDALAPRCQP